jgi:type I restriction enzyme S subunit
MQRLLTGQVRVEGNRPAAIEDSALPEGWQRLRLDQAFKRIQRKITEDVAYVLSITAKVGFVDQRSKFGKVIAGQALERYTLLRKGEFAYNKGNSTAYPQGCIYRLEEFEEGAVPNVYYCFAPRSAQFHSDFYKQYFASGALNKSLRRLINSGVRNDGLLNLAPEEFFGVEILVPPTPEQQKIAEILNCADAEISAQEQRFTLLRQQKRGLMQRLLTGQVRVAVDAEVQAPA